MSGNQVLLDGRPFEPRGFTLVAALAGACNQTDAVAAASHFGTTGESELGTLVSTWDANTVRFQVSQAVLSGPNAASYVTGTIVPDVVAAENAGLVVILSMQDEGTLVCGAANPTWPTAETETAWSHLAAAFASDSDVMFELFNEPYDPAAAQPKPLQALNPLDWQQWHDGAPAVNGSGATVGYQNLVTYLRGTLQVPNVLIADGLNKAGVLPGKNQGGNGYLLTDPLVDLAYSVHPYADTLGAADWAFRFADLSETVPVIATEWNYTTADTTSTTDQCGPTLKFQTVAPQFLSYLSDRGIGVLGFAADVDIGSALIADWTWAPNPCPGSVDGPGPAYHTYTTNTQTRRLSNIALSVTPATVTIGSPVTVSGTLTIGASPAADGVPVSIVRNGTSLGTVLTSGGTGSFSVTDTPPVAGTTTYTATYTGNPVTASATKQATALTLLIGASLSLGAPASVHKGALAALSGRLAVASGSPAGQAIRVYYRRTGGTYPYVLLAGLSTNSAGGYAYSVRLSYSGYFYTLHLATATVGRAMSAYRFVTVN